MDFLAHLLPVAALLIVILLVYNHRRNKINRSLDIKSPPEPPGAWPIIGHLHLFATTQTTMARTLGNLADKFGPVFTIRLGMDRALVVSSHEAVKECFTINDKAFATRPPSNAGKHLAYNYAGFGFSPDGPYWREIRKLVLLEVLSSKRLEALKHVRTSEIDTSIKELYSYNNSGKVVISKWIEQLSFNVIVKTIAGKRYVNRVDREEDEEAKDFKRVIREFMIAAGQFVVSDFIPFPLLRWIDFGGYIKSMKRISQEMDGIIQIWVDEHIERRSKRNEEDDQDFVDVMLSVIDDNVIHGHKRETIIKATIMTMILGGAETLSVVLTWLLSLLLNDQRVMERAKEEIEMKIGRERWVEESDIKNLNSLQAIVKETLRLYPPAPLSIPHQAKEDCKVCGYLITKGTRLFVNLWKLHRDPRIWSEPNDFQPERFLIAQADLDVFGHHFEYVPFGSGRRSCPGIAFGMEVAHLVVARLLQGFDFTRPLDLSVDMSEGQGITMPKANPLEVILTPRLSPLLYEK